MSRARALAAQAGMELAAMAGGHILTREKNNQLVPEQAIYRVTLKASDMPDSLSNHVWRGNLTIHAKWETLISRHLRQVLAVLICEAGF